MILNKDQLDKIDQKLDSFGLDFLDFKIEIKDHIASDIECEIEKNSKSFDEALAIVFNKWNLFLSPKENWLISRKEDLPRIVVEKLHKRFLIFNLTKAAFILFAILFVYLFKDKFLNKHIELFNINYIKILNVILFIIILIMRFLLFKDRKKTSYSYMFNQNHWSILVFQGLLYISLSNALFLYSISVLLVITPFIFYYYIKHKKFIHQFKLV
jgi:hypothetical protein